MSLKTMTDLLLAEEEETLVEDGVVKTVYDMAMGTSQMLTCMEERLLELDADAEVTNFGQEINHETFSIAKSDAIIKGSSAENMRLGDTLANDQFEGYEFDYIISNPPISIICNMCKYFYNRLKYIYSYFTHYELKRILYS